MPERTVTCKTAQHGMWVYLNGLPLYFVTRSLLAKALAHVEAGDQDTVLDEVVFTTKGKRRA